MTKARSLWWQLLVSSPEHPGHVEKVLYCIVQHANLREVFQEPHVQRDCSLEQIPAMEIARPQPPRTMWKRR